MTLLADYLESVVIPEAELLDQLRAGDEAAFAQLLDDWSGGMLRLARTFVATEASAAEVVQDTWVAVIEGLAEFEGRSSLKTWVYRILTNVARRRGSREHRVVPMSSVGDTGSTVDPARFQPPGAPFPGHWWEFPPNWPTPEEGALDGEGREVLAAALAELPDRQRAVVVLRDVEGYESAEVCALLEITPANQRVLLHRGRAYLRGALEKYYAEVTR